MRRRRAPLVGPSGTQFDPDVVTALMALMKEQEVLRNIG
jgi:hypothetical protein